MIDSVCAEGYGPGGTAVIVVGPARDAALCRQVREVLCRDGGRLGAENAVAYLFRRVGVLRYPNGGPLAERALAAGAEDIRQVSRGEIEVLTDPTDLEAVRESLARRGHPARATAVTWRAQQQVTLDAEQMAQLASLVDALRRLEGVTEVCTNAANLDSLGGHGYP